MSGLGKYDELDRWYFDELTDYRGSFASHLDKEYSNIKQPIINVSISSEQWEKC
jgi:hypothetical protein